MIVTASKIPVPLPIAPERDRRKTSMKKNNVNLNVKQCKSQCKNEKKIGFW